MTRRQPPKPADKPTPKEILADLRRRYTDTECARGSHLTQTTSDGSKQCKNCGALLCNHYRNSLMGCMLKRGHSGKHANPNNTRLLFADDGAASLDSWTDDEGRYVELKEDWYALVDGLDKRLKQ